MNLFLKLFVIRHSFFYKEIAELNFWTFLIGFLQASSLANKEEIIIFFCLLGVFIVLSNFFWKIFQGFSLTAKFLILYLGISCVLIPVFIYFFTLPFFLRAFLSALLAIFYIIFCFLIWSTSSSKEYSFPTILKKFLPRTLFALFILSLATWMNLLGLLFPFTFFLIYNFSFLKNVLFEDFKGMVLRSSFLFNFFRFFLPFPLISEIFLFSELIIFGPGILGLLKVQGLLPKSSGFERFLNIQPRPRYFFTGLSTHYLKNVLHISEVLEKQLPLLLEEFSKPFGDPSNILRKTIEEFPVKRLQPFLKSNNFYESHEFLHFIVLKVLFVNKLVVPSNLIFPHESIPTLNPQSGARFETPQILLKYYFLKKGVDTPFIFVLKKTWFLGFSQDSFSKFKLKKVVATLNESVKDNSIWGHNIPNEKLGRHLAIFPAQDFISLNPATYTFDSTVQAKSSFSEEAPLLGSTTSTADFLCVITVEDGKIELRNISTNKVMYSEMVFDFKNRISDVKFQKQLIQSFLLLDKFLADEAALNRVRFDIANDLILKGAKPLPSSLVKKEDF